MFFSSCRAHKQYETSNKSGLHILRVSTTLHFNLTCALCSSALVDPQRTGVWDTVPRPSQSKGSFSLKFCRNTRTQHVSPRHRNACRTWSVPSTISILNLADTRNDQTKCLRGHRVGLIFHNCAAEKDSVQAFLPIDAAL